MATSLFPVDKYARYSTSAVIKTICFPDLLTDFACAAYDAKDALELFYSLCKDDDGVSSSPGFMAFDAHVGDTSCQIRAAMFLTLYHHFKSQDKDSPLKTGMKRTIQNLGALITRIRELYPKLTRERRRLATLNIKEKGETRQGLLEILEWKELGSQPSSGNRRDSVLENKGDVNICVDELTKTEIVDSELGSCQHWDPCNISQIVRFLIFSYILSKYKAYSQKEVGVACRLDPALVLGAGARVIMDIRNERYHVWAQNKRVVRDFETMQNWVCDIGIAWLKATAARQFGTQTQMIRLLDETKQKSVRGLIAVPAWVGWLTIRQLILSTSTPIFLLVRRMCSEGFHTNYFKVKLEGTDQHRSNLFGADTKIHWRLTQVPAHEVLSSKDVEPHLTIYGSSIDGDNKHYLERTSQPLKRHHDANCADNIEHCRQLLVTDHDEIAFSTMGFHRHYAFSVTDEAGRDEREIVVDSMDAIAPGLSDWWRKHHDQAYTIGTCKSFKTFVWQHVVLETPGRAVSLREASIDALPLRAPIQV